MASRRAGLWLVLLTALGSAPAQFSPAAPSGPFGEPALVRFEPAGPAQLAVGKPGEAPLRFRIREGLHINSHRPTDKDLLRTELLLAEPPDVDVQAVAFPDGAEYASQAFPGQKLSVYTGELVLHARLLASKPGAKEITGALRYQACDAERCFAPKTVPVALDLAVR